MNVAGAVAGGLLWVVGPRIRSPRFWLALLAAAVWIGAAMQLLSPFSVSPEYRPFVWVPFLGQYANPTIETLRPSSSCSSTFRWGSCSQPLVCSPAFTPGSRRALLRPRACMPARCSLPPRWLPIEYLQGWIVGRYPDVTGVLLAMLGTAAGAWTGGAGWLRFRAMIA